MALRQPPQTSDAFFAQLLHAFLSVSLTIAGVLGSAHAGLSAGADDANDGASKLLAARSCPDEVAVAVAVAVVAAKLKLKLGDEEVANELGSAGAGNSEDETGPNVKAGYVPVFPATAAVKGLTGSCGDAVVSKEATSS